MSTAQNYDERKADIDKKIAQLKAQKKKLENREKADERKKRTHRLIQIGAVLESAFEIEINPEYLAMHLAERMDKKDESSATYGQVYRSKYKKTADRIQKARDINSDTEG